MNKIPRSPEQRRRDKRSANISRRIGERLLGHAEKTRRPVIGRCLTTGEVRYFRSTNDVYTCGGFSSPQVRQCLTGKRDSFKGWRFKYATKQERKQYETSN